MDKDIIDKIIEIGNSQCRKASFKIVPENKSFRQQEKNGTISTTMTRAIELQLKKSVGTYKKSKKIYLFEPDILNAVKKLNKGKILKDRITAEGLTKEQIENIIYIATDKILKLSDK